MMEQIETIKKTQHVQPFNQWPQNQQNYLQPQFYPIYNPCHQQRRNNRRRNRSNFKYVGTRRYCWTYGACDHWGRSCRHKAQGHIDEADFIDTKGGNIRGVRTWRCGMDTGVDTLNHNYIKTKQKLNETQVSLIPL